MKPIVEIVCCSVDDCVAATEAGAGRIELCSAIELGGLTPSVGLVSESRKAVSTPLMVMVRPRPGGLCYSEAEFQTMLADCEVLESQADGLVFGVLQPDRSIDRARCKRLTAMAADRETVFHRAFDQVPDAFDALETLIDLGFTRILTSGLAPSAAEGSDMIQQLIERADGRIEIMPGGSVRSANVERVLATGCSSVHLAPRRPTADGVGALDPGEVARVVAVCNG